MIDLAFVESLIRALDESGLDFLELDRGGTRLRLSKSPPASGLGAPAQGSLPVVPGTHAGPLPVGTDPTTLAMQSAAGLSESEDQGEAHDGLLKVICPMVGTYYSSPSPDASPYVAVGQSVGKGTVLCIIEAMKLMNELESEVEGTIAKVMVENAQPVEYGQILFLVDPS
ncbi:MAG: acetyl-CoA carboxylase biotin carboxyl carrier protein [Gemmatimonadota bacterium]